MGQIGIVGLGVYLVGHGICNLTNPGSYAMIGGGIAVIISAFI